jgi:hypothetical protein
MSIAVSQVAAREEYPAKYRARVARYLLDFQYRARVARYLLDFHLVRCYTVVVSKRKKGDTMQRFEMNDPVVRAVVLMREAKNILKDYEVALPYVCDKEILLKTGEP